MKRLWAFVIALAFACAPALAQEAGGLRFVAGPGAQAVADWLAASAGEDRSAVAAQLGRDWDGVTEVRVAIDAAGFTSLLPDGAQVPGWAEGVAFPSLNLVVVRGTVGDARTRGTLRHELSHVAVGRLAGAAVPRWFLEGLATIQAGDAWTRKGPSLVRAGLSDGLFSFDALTAGFPSRPSDAELAYAQSADFVQFLVDEQGEAALHDVLQRLVAGDTFEEAFIGAMHASPRAMEHAWRRSLAKWELVARFVTASELWWGLATLLFAWAWWRVRRVRRQRLRLMELQEQADDARAFAERSGFWTDRPEEQGAPALAVDAPFDDEDDAADDLDHGPDAGGDPQKKPTIH